MIDTIVKATEKLGQLLEIREKRKREVCEKVIAPTYAALAPVHVDYMKMFDNCVERLRRSNEPLDKLVATFRSDRDGLDHVRRGLRATAEVFRERTSDTPYGEFFSSAHFYLSSPQTTWSRRDPADNLDWRDAGLIHNTAGTGFLNKMADVQRALENDSLLDNEQKFRNDLEEMADMIQRELRRRWSLLSERYAESIAHSMSL